MGLPSSSDLITMNFGFNGEPAVLVPASSSINTFTMDFGFNGEPFVINPGISGPAHLKTLFGIAVANIKTINGIPIANVKTFTTVT